MAEAYLSLEDAARYEGLTYKGFTSRLQRNPNAFKTKWEPRESGRDKVLVAVSSLSKNARQVYKEAQLVYGLDNLAEKPLDTSAPPWYVEYDPVEYSRKYGDSYQKGITNRQIVEEYLAANEVGNPLFKKNFLESHGMSARTFDRNLSNYRTASAWALYMERLRGSNYDYYKVLALSRKPKAETAFRSYEVDLDGVAFDLKVVINRMWFETDRDLAPNRRTVAKLQRNLEKYCKANGITDIPSEKTLYRYIAHLNEHCNGRDVKYYLSNGELAYKQNRMVRARRNLKELGVMQILVADAHTFDCWVEYTYPNGKKTAIRPILVAWIDMKSRMVFGDVICEHPNANTVAQSFYKAIYTAEGVPERILLDNGKDFTAESLTGQPRKFRLEMTNEAAGVYKGMGVENVTRALPYMPHIKAEIERFFGTVEEDFGKDMPSYTGTLTGSRTEAKVKKDIQGMLERGELYTMEEFTALWSQWLEGYHCRQHQGLMDQKEFFHTPIEVFLNEPSVARPTPPKEYAVQLAMNTRDVVVHQTGIRLLGQNYTAAELSNHKGQRVDIYWDADDMTRIYVYSKEHAFICMAHEQALLSLYPRVPQQALLDYWKMQKQQLANVRQSAEELLSLGEYIEAYDTFSKKVHGTLNLIQKKRPKVIALPQDRRFAEYAKLNKASKKQPDSYLLGEGQKALDELRKLG